MTVIDPDAMLDQRLIAMFTARADEIAAEAPTAAEMAGALQHRLGEGALRLSVARHVNLQPWWRLGVSAAPSTRWFAGRAATVLAAILVLLILAAALAASAGRWSLNPTPSVTLAPSPAPAVSPVALAAPLGYQGRGTIEFTRSNASGGSDVWLIDPAGTTERLFVAGGCCGLMSPDGRQLAASVPGGGLHNPGSPLLGINVYGLPDPTVSTTIPAACGVCGIITVNSAADAWSKDNRQVAVDIWSDGDPAADGMAIAGGPPDVSWRWGTGALGPGVSSRDLPLAFSPDGTMLLFLRQEQSSSATSTGPLFLLTIATRTARQITPPNVSLSTNRLVQSPASWSPDGSRIVFVGTDSTSGGTSIYAAGVAPGAKLETLVPNVTGATSARFSPDGSWIAFDRAAEVGAPNDLSVVHPDGTAQRNLSGAFAPSVCCGVWSPDGRALLVAGSSSDATHSDLFVISLSGQVWQVTQDSAEYSAFGWAPSAP